MVTTKYYKKYLELYGHHFTKSLCDFAVSMMQKKEGQITPMTKQQVEEKLRLTGTTLQYNKMYDFVYVANMCKADYLGSSVPNDDIHLCKYIKDTVDDPDGYDGQIFDRWISDMIGMHIPVDWSEFI